MDNSSEATSSQLSNIQTDGSHSQRSKKYRKNSPIYKETIITAVLQDLQDDVIDSPKCMESPNGTDTPNEGLSSARNTDGTNALYIQHRNTFKQIPKIFTESSSASLSCQSTTPGRFCQTCEDCKQVWIALNVQSWIRTFYVFIHGIAGGLALAYIILLSHIVWNVKHFFEEYYEFCLIAISFFDLLNIISIVSILDKIDPLHVLAKGNSKPESLVRKWLNYLSLFCYLLSLLLHQISIPFENILLQNEEDINRTTNLDYIDQYKINEWYNLSIFKSTFLFFGWLLIAVYPTQDALKRNFKLLSKYHCRETKGNKPNRF